MRAWKVEAEKIAPEKTEEIAAFVASYDPMFGALTSKAESRTVDGRAALARAVAAGAGKPRATDGLRRSVSKAMMWAARKLEER